MSVKSSSLHALAALAARDFPRTQFGSIPYGVRITDCNSPGKIALTFDDGPSIYTQGIVNTLEANGAKGTFFIVGSNGESGLENTQFHPMVKTIAASGHQIGHHSWSHPYLNTIGTNGIIEEVTKLESLFISVLGFTPTYFRPPYTECDANCYATLGSLGYHVTDYNLDTLDWDTTWAHKEQYAAAIQASNPASQSKIVLAHDIQEFTGTTDFVQFMIDTARAQGYNSFVTLGECLGDPASNWYRDPSTGGPWTGGSNPPDTTTQPTQPPTTSPTLPPTTHTSPTRYVNTTVTRTGTTFTTVCPEPTPTPTGCKGRTCHETSLEPHPSKSKTYKPTGTTTGKPTTSTKPAVVEVNAAVAQGASFVTMVLGALAWIML